MFGGYKFVREDRVKKVNEKENEK